MYTLYIDTHFKDIVFVLYKNDNILNLKEKLDCDQTSKYTISLLNDLFMEVNVDIKQVNKIIACNGPGSFTGVRIAATIAKNISFALNVPIFTINSLEVSALSNIGLNTFGVKENNGFYMANFENDKMISDITYIKGNEYTNVIFNNTINYSLIPTYQYLKKTDCFNTNPLYIKTIGALNDKKSD